ncbi:MAG TPA: hypothetical protein VGF69_10880 [Thermoanaerobaculia bacterium]|jgi:hypothetical protein
MTDDVLMLEAALFQLRSALGDDPASMQIRIGANVLANALDSARQGGVNAARVNDIEFALNDLIAVVDDCGAPDSVFPILGMLQNDIARLRKQTALPQEVVRAVRELQSKLKARGSAIERNTYRAEGTPGAELPHAPEELRAAALPIREQLTTAGFTTAALDELIAEPASVRFHQLQDIVDELDVILGGA